MGPLESVPIVVGIVRDVTELHDAQARLERQATHDALTDLPNRTLFCSLVEQALARARRRKEAVAVLFVDLDHFKAVNDSLGHHVGDTMLVEAARRMHASVRRGDVVARFGGDEFLVLCEGVRDRADVVDVGRRIVMAMEEPVVVIAGQLRCGASVGVALEDARGVTAEELLRRADTALYRAKALGRGRVSLYDEGP